MNNLEKKYKKDVVPKLKKQFLIGNDLAVPRVEKVVVNAGLGKGLQEKSFAEHVTKTLRRITGQNPVLTKAKKSIASFKIRQGMVIGAKVTLRGNRMYDFVEKLIKVSLPRVRDFRGLTVGSFDRKGNFTIGVAEHIIFPEIKADEVEKLHGLEIVVHTTARNDQEGYALLKFLGFPFKDDIQEKGKTKKKKKRSTEE